MHHLGALAARFFELSGLLANGLTALSRVTHNLLSPEQVSVWHSTCGSSLLDVCCEQCVGRGTTKALSGARTRVSSMKRFFAALMLVAATATGVSAGEALRVEAFRQFPPEHQGAAVLGAMEVIFALGFRCRVAVSPSMVVATLNTTGEDRIEDSAPFSAAVVHILDEVYGCSLPASPKKNRM